MATLIEFCTEIKPARTHALPSSTGKSLYSFLLSTIKYVDPSLAKIMHDYNGPKPFTVSRLIGRLKKENGNFFVLEENTYKVRFTSFSDLISKALIEALSPIYASREGIILWGEDFEILAFSIASLNGYPPVTTTEDLKAIAKALSSEIDKVEIRFTTETAFRFNDRNLLFPEPQIFFSSVLKRLKIAGVELTADVDWTDKVSISRYKLKTSVVNFGKIPFQGFKGTVEYDISKLPPDIKTEALLLSLALNYTGVGAKTTAGMGQAHLHLTQNIREAIFSGT